MHGADRQRSVHGWVEKTCAFRERLDTTQRRHIAVHQADNDRYRVFPRSTPLRQIPVYIIAVRSGILSGRLQSDEDICEREICQGAQGGVGDCKAAGNYAASLYASEEALENWLHQVLWLDAKGNEIR